MISQKSVYAFPSYLNTNNTTLVRASGTNLPLEDESVDVSICWGVLHHMDEPFKGLDELLRVTKPGGGEILIFIYSKGLRARKILTNSQKILKSRKSLTSLKPRLTC